MIVQLRTRASCLPCIRSTSRRLTTALVVGAVLTLLGCTDSTPSATPTDRQTTTAADEPSERKFSVIYIPAGYGLKIAYRINLRTGNWVDRAVIKQSASMAGQTGDITSGGQGFPLRDGCKIAVFAKSWKLSGGRPRCPPLE